MAKLRNDNAEYNAALVAVNESFSIAGEHMDALLLMLQNEMETLLLRMAAQFTQLI